MKFVLWCLQALSIVYVYRYDMTASDFIIINALCAGFIGVINELKKKTDI